MEFTISAETVSFFVPLLLCVGVGILRVKMEKDWGPFFFWTFGGLVVGGLASSLTTAREEKIEKRTAEAKVTATMSEPWQNLHQYLTQTDNEEAQYQILKSFGEKYCGYVSNFRPSNDVPLSITTEQYLLIYETDESGMARTALKNCVQVDLEHEFANLKQEPVEEPQETPIDPAKTFDDVAKIDTAEKE